MTDASNGKVSSDGSDGEFRQRVDPKYKEITQFKSSLQALFKVHTLMLVLLFSSSAFLSGDFVYHPLFLAAVCLPLVATKGMESSSVWIMTGYSAGTALATGIQPVTIWFHNFFHAAFCQLLFLPSKHTLHSSLVVCWIVMPTMGFRCPRFPLRCFILVQRFFLCWAVSLLVA